MIIESLETNKWLGTITEVIIHKLAKRIFSSYTKNEDNYYIFTKTPFTFRKDIYPEIRRKNCKDVNINKLLLHTKVEIFFKYKEDKRTTIMFGEYDPHYREIYIYCNDELSEAINANLKANKDYNRLYLLLYAKLNKTVIHEVRHAYDDFISKGKAMSNSQLQRFHAYTTKPGADEEAVEFQKKYINTDAELSAHYTQAVADLQFFALDEEADIDTWDQESSWIKLPWSVILSEFKKSFPYYWEHISDKNKKRLLIRLGQAYTNAKLALS